MDLQTHTHSPNPMLNLLTLISVTINLHRRVIDATSIYTQLEEFKSIISRIRYVLCRFEAYLLCETDVSWLERLRLAIYEADDYFDYIFTIREKAPKCWLLRKVQQQLLCFSSEQKIYLWPAPEQVFEKVQAFQERLSIIAGEVEAVAKIYGDKRREEMRERMEETFSLVNAGDVVGRDDDKKAVVDMLLNPNARHDLAIVGLAGIGKTTLARLVFNDPRVFNEFPLRFWVSVSDCDYDSPFQILIKILESMTGQRVRDEDEIDPESKIREILGGQKYLVVLDDVWFEDYRVWRKLRGSFRGGLSGSRIMVTTRSIRTDEFLPTYELKGLSDESSWHLFEVTAFRHLHGQAYPPDQVVETGKTIVKHCSNVPLAIKTIGDILSRQESSSWRSLEEDGSVLKLCYNMLDSQLQRCFNCCAVFPYDYVIRKRMLISMWMALGYLRPSYEGRWLEDIGEEYISILVKSLFFEVVETDEYGDIVSFRIHNLMHAFAKEASRWEISDRISHPSQSAEILSVNKVIVRLHLEDSPDYRSVDLLANNWATLRVLHLRGFDAKTLPDSIRELWHLRYLNLSHSKNLEALPHAIVNLWNLQTLDLSFCTLLKELPHEFSNLRNLRCLDMFGCDGLAYLPAGMDKLSCLRLLSQFVVAEANSSDKQFCSHTSRLRDLKSLVALEGHLCILIPKSYTHVKRIEGSSGCMEALEHLRSIWIRFMETHSADGNDARVVNFHETLLENLQPHHNLRELSLWGFQGSTIPRWGRAEDNWASTLPYLVKVEIRSCERLQHLPLLSELRHLKSLKLYGLRNLEFLENTINSTTAEVYQSQVEESAFFPRLEELEIVNAPKLKGFRVTKFKGRAEIHWVNFAPNNFAPNLITLKLRSCERLWQIPSLIEHNKLKSVKLYNLKNQEYLEKTRWSRTPATATVSQSIERVLMFFVTIEELEIVNVPKLRGYWSHDNGLVSPPTPSFTSLK